MQKIWKITTKKKRRKNDENITNSKSRVNSAKIYIYVYINF